MLISLHWVDRFLVHLSRRLTRWAYSIPMFRRLSIIVVHPSVHTFKFEYLWGQLANLYKMVCVASLWWGKGCISLLGRFDKNSGFYGNRKRPLAYNGEYSVSTFSLLFFYRIFFKLTGNEDRHKISDKFQFRPDLTTPHRVRCPWASKKIPIDF